jgi:acetoin utilization protein AcuB
MKLGGDSMERTIDRHMVRSPYVATGDFTLKEALEMMKDCGIRHLPIIESDLLVGVVSENDIRTAIARPSSNSMTVNSVMKTDLVIAYKTSSLLETVRRMAEEKVGSVLIVDSKMHCIGIFTTIDALEILAELLEDDENPSRVANLDDYIDYWKLPGAIAL